MKRSILKIFALALVAGAILSVSGCKKNPPIDTSTFLDKMLLLAKKQSAVTGFDVEVYGRDSFYVGYNPLYIKVTDQASGEMVTNDAQMNWIPMMDMGTMMHSAPFENPGAIADTDKVYSSAVVFIMPSTAGTWMLKLAMLNTLTQAKDTLMFMPNVLAPQAPRMFSTISLKDSSKLFVSLMEPFKPKVGINDFHLSVHKKQSMMSFPPVEGLTINSEPEMPAMGHGSPNNEDPVSTGNGHYKGKVNFTMSGLWHINLKIFDGIDAVDTSKHFIIDFL